MKADVFNLYLKAVKYYDYDNRDNLTDDIPFYHEYAVKSGNEVLELGCGTGRVAVLLAEAGFNVTGLDLSESMLTVFEEKLKKLPESIQHRVHIRKGNMSNFSLGKKFNLIIAPFRVFQALTEEGDIKGCLQNVREHLSENGIFIINVFRPYKVLDESWCYPETIQWETQDQETGIKIVKKHWGSRIDPVKQVIYPSLAYEISDASGNFERIVEKLSLRYYYHRQLKNYLMVNGLKVVEEYGWYDRSDIKNGRELIFVCRKGGRMDE